MDLDVIDGADRRVGVGVSREQRALCVRKQGHGFGQETHAIHLRHALIGQQQGHGIVASLQLAQGVERDLPRVCAQHAITVCIIVAQIALDGTQHFGVIIYRQ